ncbi:MAG: glycoside hydrolase family 130 protein [Anaerolineae bacterium]|nr:glycoside hydrolase family 130 protein [Anaerolineae bacterium]
MTLIGDLTSSPVIQRYAGNPILTAADIPYPADLIFNAGVAHYQGRYVMVFRNDYNFESTSKHKTNLGLAYSEDGIKWQVQPAPIFALDWPVRGVRRAYDPRLLVLDGRVSMCFALDTDHGVRGGIAFTDDFEHWDIVHLSTPDNRNMVLFPEKINGQYVRLERPFPVYSRGGERFDIWLSTSPDLVHWGNSQLVLAVEDVSFANTKLGPTASPIKTEYGWLTAFHAVDTDPARGKNGWEDAWKKRYTVGLMLLDLENPARVTHLYSQPLMAPEAPYEVDGGFRNNVIFPTGMLLEANGEVRFYYGAADTVMCLATARLDDLLGLLGVG